MTIAELRDICLSFPAVTEDIKWEDHLCFMVGSKIFLITSPDEVPVSASFKTSNDDFETLSIRPGCIPAPYLARNKWILVDNIDNFSKKEWIDYLEKAYRMIASKLTLKLQKQIASGQLSKGLTVKRRIAKKKKSVAKQHSKKTAQRKSNKRT